jgi:hypothetical protein
MPRGSQEPSLCAADAQSRASVTVVPIQRAKVFSVDSKISSLKQARILLAGVLTEAVPLTITNQYG